jgi:hypothetical protein
MKNLIFVCLAFLPTLIKAQDCALHRETDPYTREIKLSTGFITLQGGSVTIDADKNEIDIFFSVSGIDKCYDNNSTANVFFEGTRAKLLYRNGGTMNCEGFFHFIFKNTAGAQAMLQKFITQKVNNIVFTGNNKAETKLSFTPEQQQQFSTLVSCLVAEAKTLIK